MLVPPNFYGAWAGFLKSLTIDDMEGNQMLTREGETEFYSDKEQVKIPLDYYTQLKVNEYLLDRISRVLNGTLSDVDKIELISILVKGGSQK